MHAGATTSGLIPRRRSRLAALAGAGAAALCAQATAAAAAAAEVARLPYDLNSLSLEELSNIEVTSVSKAPERLGQAAAAVYVITREDIRRSGASSLPEALRLAPNLEVAQQNAASYAITARGFNSPQSGNKLLVLIDGRSVYTPIASTVFWETLGVALADIERIEVVSGPGGTLWGANAVNGVINVITRSAADTKGALIDAGAGSRDRTATLRYGGALGESTAFRVYGTAFNRGRTFDGRPGDAASDATRGVQGGFRIDGTRGRDSYTLQGDAYRNRVDVLDYRLTGQNLLGRWTRPFSDDASLTVQGYYDRADRRYQTANDLLETLDVQAQVNLRAGDRHKLVFGGEGRVWRSSFESMNIFGFPDPKATLTLGSVFAQDEVTLSRKLLLTLGLKLETNSYSGLDYLPNARLAWRPSEHTLLWGAISRSVRTPSRIDRELQAPGVLSSALDFASEKLTAYEIGGRVQSPRASLSVSAFYNVYGDLRTTEFTRGGLPIMLRNGLEARTYGVEAWGAYGLTPSWRLSAGISTLNRDAALKPGHVDLAQLQSLGQDPAYQASLRSELNVTPRLELDGRLRAVGRVSPSNVPAYVEADLRLGWRIGARLQLSLDGRNLLRAKHLEVINPETAPVTAIPRSVYLSLRWEL